MALSNPSASPAVTVREIDLSGVEPNVQTTTGAFVGNFRWGPVDKKVLLSGEGDLASTFHAPSKTNAVDFMSAAYFLKYSSSLFVVRQVTSDALNAATSIDEAVLLSPAQPEVPATYVLDSDGNPVVDSDGNPVVDTPAVPAVDAVYSNPDQAVVVKNADAWESMVWDTSLGSFVAKYPGLLGNSLSVHVYTAEMTSANFSTWTYSNWFTGAPETSPFAEDRGCHHDEVHVVVTDRLGHITGTPGSVLETFPFVSVAADAKAPDGSPNYIKDVIDAQSAYVWFGGFGDELSWGANSGSEAIVGSDTHFGGSGAASADFDGGADSGQFGTFDYSPFADVDDVQVDFLICPAEGDISALNAIAVKRKDCVAVASPPRAMVSNPVQVESWAKSLTFSSSYVVIDNNWLKVYDKYNDQYVTIPAASSTAGVMAATDASAAPWFSPAGQRRGQYLGVTDIVAHPDKGDRDMLYKVGVNPIANIPGQGVILFGDKTFLNRPSAFDRINVRRMFLAIERSISIAGRNVMFEFNDEFTRAEFVNIVEPLLREIQGRRGITDFRVVCDETNNTPAVVDRNEFVASIFIKPARSINFVTLNFVAVRSGVDFDEVVGVV